jgi:hypothetical protein
VILSQERWRKTGAADGGTHPELSRKRRVDSNWTFFSLRLGFLGTSADSRGLAHSHHRSNEMVAMLRAETVAAKVFRADS